MKIFKLTIVLCMLFSFLAYGQEANLCLENSKTQSEMNRCEGINFEKADAELNRVYGLIRIIYEDDTEFLSKLKNSQRAWIKLRDADMEMRFPLEKKQFQYGSVYPMCFSGISTTLTLQRVGYLKQWLEGIGEGDVCSGSIKRPYEIREAINKI